MNSQANYNNDFICDACHPSFDESFSYTYDPLAAITSTTTTTITSTTSTPTIPTTDEILNQFTIDQLNEFATALDTPKCVKVNGMYIPIEDIQKKILESNAKEVVDFNEDTKMFMIYYADKPNTPVHFEMEIHQTHNKDKHVQNSERYAVSFDGVAYFFKCSGRVAIKKVTGENYEQVFHQLQNIIIKYMTEYRNKIYFY